MGIEINITIIIMYFCPNIHVLVVSYNHPIYFYIQTFSNTELSGV